MSFQIGSRWPTVKRTAEFDRAWAALAPDSGFQGVMLSGESGTGKSTLARELAGRLEADGTTVCFALGTQSCGDVPLGAFSRAVRVETVSAPAIMLASAHRALEAEQNLVIVVDDAHLLDPLSATLICQLATSRTTRLVVTIRSDEPTLDGITALVKEQWLLNLHVPAFTLDQTGELTRQVLGGDVDAEFINALHRRCAGNPLWLRALLRAGLASGAVEHLDDGWRLRDALRPDQELLDLVEHRLRALTPSERSAMEILAAAEVLDWQILRELCDDEALASLEQHGLIQLVPDGSDLVAQLNHPIFGEAAIHLAGAVRRGQINGALARTLRRHLETSERRTRLPDGRGWIRLAQFMIRGDDEPDVGVITAAAATAANMLNLDRAEQLARFAVDHGGGVTASVELANILGWRGRGTEAERVFAESVSAIGSAPPDQAAAVEWGCFRAANLFMGCGEIDAAQRLLGAWVGNTPAGVNV